VIQELQSYSFPGNVRELENVILNAVAKTPDDQPVDEIDINSEISNASNISANLITIDEAVQQHIKSVLDYTNGNVQKAAAILGVSERTLQRRLQQMRNNKN